MTEQEVRKAISDAILKWHTPSDSTTFCAYSECTHLEDAAIAIGEVVDD